MTTAPTPAPVSLTAASRIIRPLLAAASSGRRRGAAAPRIHLLGAAGNGKTTLLLREAERAGFRSVVILHADGLDVGDLSLPVDTGNGMTDFRPPAHLLALTVEADRPGVADAWRHRARSGAVGGDPRIGPTLLLLDDLANGTLAQQTQLHALLLDHTLGASGIPLRDDVLVAATSNLAGRGYASHGLSIPVRSRIHCHLHVRVTLEEWLLWAREHGTHPLVLAFLAMRPEMLHRPYIEGDTNEADPRTWAALGDILELWLDLDTDALLSAVAGTVGTAAGTEFVAFTRDGTTAPSPRQIVDDPERADPCLDRPDAACVAVEHALLAVKQDPGTLDRVMAYGVRLDPQFRLRLGSLLLNERAEVAASVHQAVVRSPHLARLLAGATERRRADLDIERRHGLQS